MTDVVGRECLALAQQIEQRLHHAWSENCTGKSADVTVSQVWDNSCVYVMGDPDEDGMYIGATVMIDSIQPSDQVR